MRAFTRLVFDEQVAGTAAVFTSDAFSDLLGTASQLAIQVVASNISGSSPSLIVRVQTSQDGRLWCYKSATPEIDTRSITSGGTSVEVGADGGPTPSLARVRLKIALSGTSPAAYLKVWVCGRSTRRSRPYRFESTPTLETLRVGAPMSTPSSMDSTEPRPPPLRGYPTSQNPGAGAASLRGPVTLTSVSTSATSVRISRGR